MQGNVSVVIALLLGLVGLGFVIWQIRNVMADLEDAGLIGVEEFGKAVGQVPVRIERLRIGGVGAHRGVEHGDEVDHAARQRPADVLRERQRDDAVAARQPLGHAQAEQVVVGCRDADRAAAVAGVRDRHHAGGDRRRRADAVGGQGCVTVQQVGQAECKRLLHRVEN